MNAFANPFVLIEEARHRWIKAHTEKPNCLILGEGIYAALCGGIGAIEKSETPIEINEFRGLKIVIQGDWDRVSVGVIK